MLFGNIQEAAMVAGEKSFEEYNNIVSFDGKLAETVGFDAVAVSPAQLQAMVQAPVGGKLMEEWVANSFESHIVDDIKTAILADNLRGLSIDKTIEMLTDSFDMIGRDAETLARTYIADINNQAAEQVYKANDDIIQEEEWCATLEVGPSGRSTCLRCAAMDSRRFKINEDHIRPPLHHNCRCFMLPITASYRELGLDIPEMRKSLRPYTEREDLRKIVEAGQFDGEFKDFLKTRSKKHQIDLLGPNRYRLLQEGKIKFEDLVDKNGNLALLKKGKDGGYVGLES
jgi:SPP1 gp7 family putative phage head morphogenesis protein